MAFNGQIPGAVMEAGASGASVLEVFARNLFVNMDTGEIYLRSGDRSPLRSWPAKRGDNVPIQIRFVNEELDTDADLIALPGGSEIRFECRRKGDYGGTLMVQQNAWAAEDTDTDPHYDATVDFDGDGIKAAIGYGTGAELPYLDLICDIEVYNGGQRLSSATMEIRCHNDVTRGVGEATSSPGFISLGYQFAWWVEGLTGGAPTDLDGQATLHLEYGKTFVILEIGDGPPALYKYVEDPAPGVTAPDGVNLVRPKDYSYDADPEDPDAYVENIGLWALKE